mgnify:CR=1 FL=1
MSMDSTRATMLRYLQAAHGDNSALADNIVFTDMASGRQSQGHAAMLTIAEQFYHVDFTTILTVRVALFGEENAMVEADFKGWRIGAVEGVIATGPTICVPLCIVYELEHGQIQRGRVYVDVPAFRQQAMAKPVQCSESHHPRKSNTE